MNCVYTFFTAFELKEREESVLLEDHTIGHRHGFAHVCSVVYGFLNISRFIYLSTTWKLMPSDLG